MIEDGAHSAPLLADMDITAGTRLMAKRDDNAVATALTGIGNALSAGDAAAVARFWGVPGVVLADQGARAVDTQEMVAEFFVTAIQAYREQGTATAKPALRDIEWISDGLAAVSVDWLGLDSAEMERSRESSFYIMRVGDDGVARIHVAMTRLPNSDGE